MDSFYENNILKKKEELSFLPSLPNEKNTAIRKGNEKLLPDLSWVGWKKYRDKGGVYYISDIHLDHKIFKKFGTDGNKKKVERYVRNIVENLLLDDGGDEIVFPILGKTTIIIAGDTSHSFDINKIFYTELSKVIPYYVDVFVILGNHELWDFNSVEQAVSVYQELFDNTPNIHLLHNSVFIENYNSKKIPKEENPELSYEEKRSLDVKKSIISRDELLRMYPGKLQRLCSDSRRIIFGTTGFSPFNKRFNANTGIYGDSVTNPDDEINLAKEAESVYEKLCHALPKNKVWVISHMPMEDWTRMPSMKLWTYFSGHTHRNQRINDEEKHLFADNQIGYYGKRIKLNAVALDNKVDYFAYFDDGIYDISEEQYYKFYHGMTKKMRSVNKGDDKNRIKMLKNNDTYLFLVTSEKGNLYLLEGGKRLMLKNKDINYYYENLSLVNKVITEAVQGIQSYLNKISLFVKQIGGDGTIHGNIVDIDFYNHLMVDIQSGEVTPYFAFSIADRFEYPSFSELLEENRPDLYKKYIESGSNLPIPQTEYKKLRHAEHDTSTSIYKESNIMFKIQDMIRYNIIRFWNDDLIETIKKNSRELKTNKSRLIGDK